MDLSISAASNSESSDRFEIQHIRSDGEAWEPIVVGIRDSIASHFALVEYAVDVLQEHARLAGGEHRFRGLDKLANEVYEGEAWEPL